jgi:hypothetical protein
MNRHPEYCKEIALSEGSVDRVSEPILFAMTGLKNATPITAVMSANLMWKHSFQQIERQSANSC